MDIYVGSSSESSIGVGNLLKWDVDEVEVHYNSDREDGAWRVQEIGSGRVFFCYDLIRLSAPFGSIEESSLDELKVH